ncbi:MAG: hypothetical protein GY760_11095 [Deltaproteobacteria bacterium]|nr:hypothetical protein [Deltaproteobacteria bacterium]
MPIQFDETVIRDFIHDFNDNKFDEHKSFLYNPLLLSIMIMTYSQAKNIPNELNLFFDQAYHALYQKHAIDNKNFVHHLYSELEYNDFKNVLSAFCFFSYREQNFEFTYDELENYSAKSLKIRKGQGKGTTELIKDLTESVCLIIKNGIYYSFTHRSFQEYFAAHYVKSIGNDIKQIKYLEKLKHRMSSDIFFNLLYEMEPNKFEFIFIKKQIELIREKLNPQIHPLGLAFFVSCFNSFTINKRTKLTYYTKDEFGYELFKFCLKLYSGIGNRYYLGSKKDNIIDRGQLIELFHSTGSKEGDILYMEDLLKNVEHRPIIENVYAVVIEKMDTFMKLPEFIDDEIDDLDNEEDEIII